VRLAAAAEDTTVHEHSAVRAKSRVICRDSPASRARFMRSSASIRPHVVGGVTPGRGGQKHLGLPVFNTAHEAVEAERADVSMIYVPAAGAADAILEAACRGNRADVCITEGIPVNDMVRVRRRSRGARCGSSGRLSGRDHAGPSQGWHNAGLHTQADASASFRALAR